MIISNSHKRILIMLTGLLTIVSAVFLSVCFAIPSEGYRSQRDVGLIALFNILILTLYFKKGELIFRVATSILILFNLLLILYCFLTYSSML